MIDQMAWVFFSIPSLLIASTVHEFAHAYSAFLLGDATAKAHGRLTLNPIAHIDPIGALMMVLVRFGWSKPVPINEYNFQNPVVGTAITSFAGPAATIVVALISALPLRFILRNATSLQSVESNALVLLIFTFITVNISLAVFNLFPIPPLDGHKIVRAFLPKSLRYYWESLEQYSVWILVLLFLPISPMYSVLSSLLGSILNTLLRFLVG